ncbi:MAG: polyprenyl synthetase family protein [Chloroflexi bacterium]|nr:polyprenyl synthetase family protein [Chloroflexota bacterium]
MSSAPIGDRLSELGGELDRWLAAALDRWGPRAERFHGMLAYPLGWTDERLVRLAEPAPAGKRLRPCLTMLVCEAICGDAGRALPAAAAVELVHNFSLVHDDIQDQSDTRRARPTVWSNWGMAQAINVGDSLFALAELALMSASGVDPARVLECGRVLNSACLRLVEGQFRDLDLQASGKASFAAYEQMIAGKTGALIECSARLGAIFGGADGATVEGIAEYARALGAAFQYQDDYLGMWGDPGVTGKPADTDLKTRKQSLPVVLALDERGPVAERFRALFTQPSEITDDVAAAARRCLDDLDIRRRVELLVEERHRHAVEVMPRLQPAVRTAALASLVDVLLARQS